MTKDDKRDYLMAMHGVCVVPNAHGAGFWWCNLDTYSGEALPTVEAAWDHAWAKLEGW